MDDARKHLTELHRLLLDGAMRFIWKRYRWITIVVIAGYAVFEDPETGLSFMLGMTWVLIVWVSYIWCDESE